MIYSLPKAAFVLLMMLAWQCTNAERAAEGAASVDLTTWFEEMEPEPKPCILQCRTGLCLFENCNNGPQCPGGKCVFKNCKNASCTGGACTFYDSSGPQTACDGGGCKFFNHKDTLNKGYCNGEGCMYNNRPHPTFLGGYLAT